MNIKEIKMLLYEEIAKLEQEEKKEKNNIYLIDMINNALENISGNDYIKMKSDNEFTPIIFELIYSGDKYNAERLSNKLLNCLHQLAYLQSEEEEYKSDNSFLNQEKKLNDIRKELNDKLSFIRDNSSFDLNEKINKIKTYRKIVGYLKYNQIINAQDISEISKLMIKYNISDALQISALEHLKQHNIRISEKKINSKARVADKFTVLNMLSRGLEKIDRPILENDSMQKRIESIANTYISSINSKNNFFSSIINSFPKLDNDNYSFEEFDAIIKYILIDIQNKIFDNIEMIKQKDFYLDNEIREMIISSYNLLSMQYSKIREYYLTEIDTYEKNLENNDTNEEKSINKLFYSNSTGELRKKSYLEKDIEDLPEEYLYKVKLLLSKLKQDSLSRSEVRKLNNNNNVKNLIELRDDQIRILFYHLSSNNYLIVGCGDKRSNNDINLYRTMGSRNKKIDIDTPEKYEINLRNSEEVEEKINKYIEEHKRKEQR